MKKGLRNVIIAVIVLLAAGIYYYVTLPALNIHSAGCWFFVMSLIVIVMVIYALRKAVKEQALGGAWEELRRKGTVPFQFDNVLKILGALLILIFAVYLIGDLISSPIINAKKYQQLLTVEERIFTEDVEEVDYTTIPILDKSSAALLGDRKMGSMVEMVSQFEVSGDYSQINYKGRPVRVTPLRYASTIKWLTNQKEGIPAYILIDMTTQDTECVKLEEGIKYSKSEYFNRNLYRHLRFH